MKTLWMVILAATGLGLAGCGPMAYLIAPPDVPKKSVPAEYPHLPGHKLAVIVWTHESTELADADLAHDLAKYSADALKGGIEGLTFVPQSKIENYQQTNLRWTDTPPEELGRKFGAQMVLYLTVQYYSLSRGGETSLQPGKLNCACALYDLSRPRGQEKVWDKSDLNVQFPTPEFERMSITQHKTRTELLTSFSEKLTNCFRKHQEPANE